MQHFELIPAIIGGIWLFVYLTTKIAHRFTQYSVMKGVQPTQLTTSQNIRR